MDIYLLLLRVIVLCITAPLGYLAALIPAAAAGTVMSVIGLPDWLGHYPVGAMVMIGFISYFQNAITISNKG